MSENKKLNTKDQEHQTQNKDKNEHKPKKEPTHEQLQHEVEELKDKLLRNTAETENLRRRYEKQLQEVREYSISSFAKELLMVVDNLERAIEFEPENPSEELKNILDGVKMTYKELEKIFKKYDIALILPQKGEKFDYNLHYAISKEVSEEYEPDTIVGVMQAGYKIKDRLLRPAAVSVAKEK